MADRHTCEARRRAALLPCRVTERPLPSFAVAAIPFAASPSDPSNGAAVELSGRASALSSTGFTLTLAPDGDNTAANVAQAGFSLPVLIDAATAFHGIAGFSLPVLIDAATAFHGIAGFQNLQPGTFVDSDLSFLQDGSVHATRIEVDDTDATNRSIGPVFFASPPNRDLNLIGLQQEGDTLSAMPFPSDIPYTFQADPVFLISSRFNNLASLPFTPVFSATTSAVGQRIAAFSSNIVPHGSGFTAPTTLTLEPQTINGVIAAIAVQGRMTVYTVSLSTTDLIPMFGGPSTVMVYAGSSTVNEHAFTPTVGSNELGAAYIRGSQSDGPHVSRAIASASSLRLLVREASCSRNAECERYHGTKTVTKRYPI